MKVHESGRSMVEMIGVLGIIGVLSVGMVAFIPWAMDKWRAIRTIEDVRNLAIECSSQLQNKQMCDLGDFQTSTSQGYIWSLGIDPKNESVFDITLSRVPMGVCRKIAAVGWTVPTIYIGSVGPITSQNCAEISDMTFVFKRDLSDLLSDEGGDCAPGIEPVCPAGSGPDCSGARLQGYCGCKKCYPCEGYMGSGYMTTCGIGRTCKSGGCVCDGGGCPAGESNYCPEGAAWIPGGTDNCGDKCYKCESAPETCVPTCPASTGTECTGASSGNGTCGAVCKKCLSCEGYVGGIYKILCAQGAKCTPEGCVCMKQACPSGQSTKCNEDEVWIKKGTDGCSNACYECQKKIEENCPACLNGGACQNGHCVCANGFSGDDCSACYGTINTAGTCCPVGMAACYGECCDEGLRCDENVQKCVRTACPNNSPQYADGHCDGDVCFDDTQCLSGTACYMGKCVAADCREDKDCTDPQKPKCRLSPNPANNSCQAACVSPTNENGNCPCNQDADCFGPDGNPLTNKMTKCRYDAQTCVECLSAEDCVSGLCVWGTCKDVLCNTTGTISEQKCKTCAGFSWNGSACCPNQLDDFKTLPGEYCNACGGVVNEAGICERVNCSAGIANQTTPESCRLCGGNWLKETGICSAAQCQTNEDCGRGYYCGESKEKCYAAYNTCKDASLKSYSKFQISHEGRLETWYVFNGVTWWDAVNACKSIGKDMVTMDELTQKWRSIGKYYTGWTWVKDSYSACASTIFTLSTGVYQYYDKNGNQSILCH